MAATDLLPDAVLRYDGHRDALLDLHLPEAANGTLVLLVHGGFWKQRYDRTHTRAQARALAEEGFLVATPEYRRVGGDGGWPTTALDVAAAADALPGLLEDLLDGLGPVPTRAVLLGHSAGGHLAFWLAARGSALAPVRAVSLGGVVDLAEADRLGLGGGAVAALLDGSPLAEADPSMLLPEPAPLDLVLVHGVLDEEVPVELSRRFARAHPSARLVELAGVGHFEFLDPGSTAWRAALEALR